MTATEPLRIVHCLNQFFGGIGGEERADVEPSLVPGARGPGRLLESLEPGVEITATVIFGDNHASENGERDLAAIVEAVREFGVPDLLLAGPAFNAGRYGMVCGAICRGVEQELGIPALTALFAENPACEVFRREVVIVRTGEDVMSMRDALSAMLAVGRKRLRGEPLDPELDGLIPRGLRRNRFASKTGAERAVDMLLHKLSETPFETEYSMPRFDRVEPAPALTDSTRATLALVTSGGIVPRGNPDHIESANASCFGAYDIGGVEGISSETHESAHGGYDQTFASQDPNRVLPVDAARILERAGKIGRLYPTYFTTVGNGTSVDRARRFGLEIAGRLRNAGVDAVILTST